MKGLEHARHVAMVFDRSEASQTFFAEACRRYPDLANKREALKTTPWAFLVYMVSSDYAGQFTLVARDLPTLLDHALPALMAKVVELSGYCAFALGVDPALRPQIEARLAELQPVSHAGHN